MPSGTPRKRSEPKTSAENSTASKAKSSHVGLRPVNSENSSTNCLYVALAVLLSFETTNQLYDEARQPAPSADDKTYQAQLQQIVGKLGLVYQKPEEFSCLRDMLKWAKDKPGPFIASYKKPGTISSYHAINVSAEVQGGRYFVDFQSTQQVTNREADMKNSGSIHVFPIAVTSKTLKQKMALNWTAMNQIDQTRSVFAMGKRV